MDKLKIRVLYLLLSFVSFLSAQGNVGDYLKPEDGPFYSNYDFSQYYGNVQRVLTKELNYLEGNIKLQMIAIPAFSSEWMCGAFEKYVNKYYFFSSVSSIHIWNYETIKNLKSGKVKILHSEEYSDLEKAKNEKIAQLTKNLPNSIDSIHIEYNSVEISENLYNTILETWYMILRRTQYVDNDFFYLDANTYHFMMKDIEKGFMSGKTDSPPHNSINDLSVELCVLIKEFTKTQDKDTVETKIRELCKLIDKKCQTIDN